MTEIKSEHESGAWLTLWYDPDARTISAGWIDNGRVCVTSRIDRDTPVESALDQLHALQALWNYGFGHCARCGKLCDRKRMTERRPVDWWCNTCAQETIEV